VTPCFLLNAHRPALAKPTPAGRAQIFSRLSPKQRWVGFNDTWEWVMHPEHTAERGFWVEGAIVPRFMQVHSRVWRAVQVAIWR